MHRDRELHPIMQRPLELMSSPGSWIDGSAWRSGPILTWNDIWHSQYLLQMWEVKPSLVLQFKPVTYTFWGSIRGLLYFRWSLLQSNRWPTVRVVQNIRWPTWVSSLECPGFCSLTTEFKVPSSEVPVLLSVEIRSFVQRGKQLCRKKRVMLTGINLRVIKNAHLVASVA